MEFSKLNDLLKAYNEFRRIFRISYIDDHDGCIKGVVRVKNDFSDIGDNSWDLPIDAFGYCDIKLNVLIEYENKFRIIGEIQLLLSFMVEAKKMVCFSHVFCVVLYVFVMVCL